MLTLFFSFLPIPEENKIKNMNDLIQDLERFNRNKVEIMSLGASPQRRKIARKLAETLSDYCDWLDDVKCVIKQDRLELLGIIKEEEGGNI